MGAAPLEGDRGQVIAVVAARGRTAAVGPQPGPGPPWSATPYRGAIDRAAPRTRPPRRPAGRTPARHAAGVRNTPGRIGGPSCGPPGAPSPPRITGALAPAPPGAAPPPALRPLRPLPPLPPRP